MCRVALHLIAALHLIELKQRELVVFKSTRLVLQYNKLGLPLGERFQKLMDDEFDIDSMLKNIGVDLDEIDGPVQADADARVAAAAAAAKSAKNRRVQNTIEGQSAVRISEIELEPLPKNMTKRSSKSRKTSSSAKPAGTAVIDESKLPTLEQESDSLKPVEEPAAVSASTSTAASTANPATAAKPAAASTTTRAKPAVTPSKTAEPTSSPASTPVATPTSAKATRSAPVAASIPTTKSTATPALASETAPEALPSPATPANTSAAPVTAQTAMPSSTPAAAPVPAPTRNREAARSAAISSTGAGANKRASTEATRNPTTAAAPAKPTASAAPVKGSAKAASSSANAERLRSTQRTLPKTTSTSKTRIKALSSNTDASMRQSRTAYPAAALRQPVDSLASQSSIKKTGMHDTSYRIRGGGFTQAKNPINRIIISVIVAVALGFGGFGAWNLINFLAQERVDESAVTITVNDSHQALVSTPHLLNYIYSNADDAYYWITESGLPASINDRMTSDNPDRSANGKEIVYLPAGATEQDLLSYNATEFNSFDFDELQHRLLGSWMLDISSGDRGTYLQFKYINLATEGLQEEMYWFLDLQGLTGAGSVIVSEGLDQFGNNYVEGYVVLEGDQIVYWRMLSCSFDAYYRGADNRGLPETSGFFKLRIATWDFYGVDRAIQEKTPE